MPPSPVFLSTLLALLVLGCSSEPAVDPGNAPTGEVGVAPPEPPESEFTPLCNGTDLTGWEGDESLWTVEDETIVGDSTGVDQHQFLATTESYEDFELRLQFRLVDGKGNSGVQFRSKRKGDSPQVEGYQADLGVKYWGCLYDEARRDEMLAPAPRELRRVLRTDDWNDYRIRAKGDRITLAINGFQTVDYREEQADIPRNGIIALQLHSGDPMRVEFRRLRILRLDE